MQDVLTYILTSLIDHPDQLRIEEEIEDDILRFNVYLSEEDYPRVIGKHGLTIKAITDIIRTYKSKNGEDTQKLYINIKS